MSSLPGAPAPGTSQTHTPRSTAWDAVERLLDFLSGDPTENGYRSCRRAVLDAYREFATAAKWTYLVTAGRVHLQAPQTSGTVQFQATAGAYPNLITLTGGTWPSWAATAYLRVGGVVARVGQVLSGTTLQLASDVPLYTDQPAGTPYTLFQDSYLLPADYQSQDNASGETVWGELEYVPPRAWHSLERFCESYSTPRWYTVTGDPWHPGRLCMRLYPSPDRDSTLDFLYTRTPRPVRTFDLSAGTATVSLSSPTTVNLAGAGGLTQAHVGSTLRLSADALAQPTGLEGLSPYAYEGTILAVASSTQCTVDEAVAQAFTAVAFRVSDPIDVEDLSMLTAFFRCCEKNLSIERSQKKETQIQADYRQALLLAREADARVQQRRNAGVGVAYRPRLAFMPGGGDIS